MNAIDALKGWQKSWRLLKACPQKGIRKSDTALIRREPSIRRLLTPRYALRDGQSARIDHLLPATESAGRNSELGNRMFVEAVILEVSLGRAVA